MRIKAASAKSRTKGTKEDLPKQSSKVKKARAGERSKARGEKEARGLDLSGETFDKVRESWLRNRASKSLQQLEVGPSSLQRMPAVKLVKRFRWDAAGNPCTV